MKQTGSHWIDPQGLSIPISRVGAFEKLAETYGQRIAAKALDIESRTADAKKMFLEICEEMFTRNAAKGGKPVKQITFYTFDRGFKVEYVKPTGEIRVYQATKADPEVKDYRRIHMDFTAAGLNLPKNEEEAAERQAERNTVTERNPGVRIATEQEATPPKKNEYVSVTDPHQTEELPTSRATVIKKSEDSGSHDFSTASITLSGRESADKGEPVHTPSPAGEGINSAELHNSDDLFPTEELP